MVSHRHLTITGCLALTGLVGSACASPGVSPSGPAQTLPPLAASGRSAGSTGWQLTFTDRGQALGRGPASGVALGDVDGDSDLDAFVTYGEYGAPAPNRVYLNDGKGHFTDSGQSLGNKISYSVGLGDFNGDGKLDAFVSNGDFDKGDVNEVWQNKGDGTFELAQTIGTTNGSVLVGDVNGDGHLDAVLCNHVLSNGSNGGHRVYLNDGTGRFADTGQILGGTQEGRKGALGDIDGDGDLDLVVGSYKSGTEIWLNDGTGKFTKAGQSLGSVESRAVALGDLDGNGTLDAFVSAFAMPSAVWLNTVTNRASNFKMTAQSIGGANNVAVKLGDLDGDGDLDAFVVNSAGGQAAPNWVFLNDGSGNFTDSGLRLGRDEGQDVALGDLNGDGRLDAFVANRTSPSRVYFNTPAPDS